MRQFLNKSALLFFVIIPFSVILILCFIGLYHKNSIVYPVNGMTDDFTVFRTASDGSNAISSYYKKIDAIKDYTIKGIKCEGGCAVLYKDGFEGIRIIEGRGFNQEDYEKKRDVILVDKNNEILCEEENGKKYFSLSGEKYEVVGVFEAENTADLRSNSYFINMNAKSLNASVEYAFADGINKEEINRILGDKFDVMDAQKASAFMKENILSPIESMVYFFLAVAFFVLLNIFNAINIWMKGRRKEIVIRKMVGARKRQIFMWLIGNYMVFVGIGFICSVIIVVVIIFGLNQTNISPSLILMVGNKITFRPIILAFLVENVCMLLIIFFMVKRYLKKEIIQLIRWE